MSRVEYLVTATGAFVYGFLTIVLCFAMAMYYHVFWGMLLSVAAAGVSYLCHLTIGFGFRRFAYALNILAVIVALGAIASIYWRF